MNIISVVQFRPRMARCRADVFDNMRVCGGLMEAAGDVGSNLVVFPELSFTGYSFMSVTEALAVSEPFDGPTFKFMRSVAVRLNAFVAWGYVEHTEYALYNSATIVSPHGDIVCRYSKNNLWGNDYLWAKSGSRPAEVVDTDIGRLSLLVCRDIRDEVPRNVPRTAADGPPMFTERKPEIVAACVNWGDGGFPSTHWMDFVANNSCVLAVANRWGEESGSSGFSQDFGKGGSAVIEPNWTVHTSGLVFGSDCVVTASIETEGRTE